MQNDAYAALERLSKDPRIDRDRIGIMGMSKGGNVALYSAFAIYQKQRGTGDLQFAAHISIVPNCFMQLRHVETTGRPIFVMAAERDDYQPSGRCNEYADRIRAAGNSNVSVKIYLGAQHNWEWIGPVRFLSKAENYSGCKATIEDSGDLTLENGRLLKGSEAFAWMKSNCMTRGAHVAGGTKARRDEATADLIAYLKRQGF